MEKYGMLTVLKEYNSFSGGSNRIFLLCKCDCGNIKTVRKDSVLSGETISCGCFRADKFKKYNTYNLSGNFGIGYTLKGEEFYFDLIDYNKIKDICWITVRDKDGNIRHVEGRDTLGNKKNVLLHKYILDAIDDKIEIDHEDKNPLNNLRYNLRICTHQENMRNSHLRKNNKSGITGVGWYKRICQWRAYLGINGEYIHLGSYDNIEDAIIARLNGEKEYFGEFAPQRHLFAEYGIE
jgi:hypothetical protein